MFWAFGIIVGAAILAAVIVIYWIVCILLIPFQLRDAMQQAAEEAGMVERAAEDAERACRWKP